MEALHSDLSIWIYSFHPTGQEMVKRLKEWFNLANIYFTDFSQATNKEGLVLFNSEEIEEENFQVFKDLANDDYKVIAIDINDRLTPNLVTWRLLQLGIIDILSWNLKDKLISLIKSRFVRLKSIQHILNSDRVKKKLVGSSSIWQKTLSQIIESATYGKGNLLILGESGTGKELIARLIHDLDNRRDKQKMILLDCSTVVPELFGSEFFGHEKGAFTNAIAMREGAFAIANKGSLFLDEVGELPINLQASLLRVIQEGTYKRLGSNIWRRSQFRLICATNRDLVKLVDTEQFRLDLFFRISTSTIKLPALRERKLDIPVLAAHFLSQALNNPNPPALDQTVTRYLMTRDYPGNIRELRQLMFRIASRYTGEGPITLGCIPYNDISTYTYHQYAWHENGFTDAINQALTDGIDLKTIKRTAGDIALQLAIDQAEGKLGAAAKQLGVSDRMVQKWKNEQ